MKLETCSNAESDLGAQVWISEFITGILPLLTVIFREFL